MKDIASLKKDVLSSASIYIYLRRKHERHSIIEKRCPVERVAQDLFFENLL